MMFVMFSAQHHSPLNLVEKRYICVLNPNSFKHKTGFDPSSSDGFTFSKKDTKCSFCEVWSLSPTRKCFVRPASAHTYQTALVPSVKGAGNHHQKMNFIQEQNKVLM